MQLADFYLRVGQRLGIVPTAGSLSAEDGAVIASAYRALVGELIEHGLVFWNSDEEVPDTYAEPVIGMTAAGLVDEFTLPEPRRSQLIMQHAFGLPVASHSERRLRALTRAAGSGVSVVEYL